MANSRTEFLNHEGTKTQLIVSFVSSCFCGGPKFRSEDNHSQLCYTAFHANKERNKNSHLITQKSFGSLGNFFSLKKGSIKTAYIDGR